MYSEPGLKPWKSRAWTPPGYTSRTEKDQRFKTHSDDGQGLDPEKKNTRGSETGVEHRA